MIKWTISKSMIVEKGSLVGFNRRERVFVECRPDRAIIKYLSLEQNWKKFTKRALMMLWRDTILEKQKSLVLEDYKLREKSKAGKNRKAKRIKRCLFQIGNREDMRLVEQKQKIIAKRTGWGKRFPERTDTSGRILLFASGCRKVHISYIDFIPMHGLEKLEKNGYQSFAEQALALGFQGRGNKYDTEPNQWITMKK